MLLNPHDRPLHYDSDGGRFHETRDMVESAFHLMRNYRRASYVPFCERFKLVLLEILIEWPIISFALLYTVLYTLSAAADDTVAF
jgi:hypothetical protein